MRTRVALAAAALWLAPAIALAQTGDSPRPLGKNLSGEDCVLTPQGGDKPPRLGIFCAGAATPAADIAVLDRKDPKVLLADRQLVRALTPGTVCAGQPRDFAMQGGTAAILSCTASDGGWPRFVLAARRERGSYLAVGFMTALDLARRVIVEHGGERPQIGRSPTARPQRPAPQPDTGDVRKRITELEAAVGGSLALIGMQDVGQFGKLRDLANSYNSLRDYSRAEDNWRRALDIQERALGQANPALGDTLGHLALNVANQSRFDEAERLFRRAEPLTRQSAEPDHYPRLLVYRGFSEEQQGRLPQALNLVGQSTQIRRNRPEARDALAHSLYAEASLALKAGELPRAQRAADEARQNFAASYGEVNWWVAETIELQGDIAVRAGRYDDARGLNTRLIEMREILFGASRPLARAFAQAAEIEQAAGRFDAALAAWRRMSNTVVRDRRARAEADANDFSGYVLAALRRSRSVPAEEQPLTDEAFRASQVPRAGATAQAIAQMSVRLAAATPELGAVARELQDGYGRMDALRQELAAAMSKPADQRNAAQEAEIKQRIARESAGIVALDKRLAREFPGYAQLQSAEPSSAAAVMKLLRPGEALLTAMSSEQGTVVFLLRDGRIRAHAVALSRRALEQVVRQLRVGLDWTRQQDDYDLELSHRLYRALLQPLEPALDGVKHLVIVPPGPLLALPPALLVARPARPRDYANAEWLVRRYAVSVAPSIEAFKALRGAAQTRVAAQPFIGFGAPSFFGVAGNTAPRAELSTTCRDKSEAIAKLLRELEPLPETAAELRAMARALKAPADSVLLGPNATEPRVRASKLEQYRVIAFATHGLLPGDLPCDAEPSLVLTPPVKPASDDNGLLDASEIATLRLNADLVILSACNTAAPDGKLGGDSLSGLTRAFFYAGARSVYAASYPVPSEQTTQLTTGIFAELAADPKLHRAEAARRSQLKLIAQRDIAHPVFWGGFMLIGD